MSRSARDRSNGSQPLYQYLFDWRQCVADLLNDLFSPIQITVQELAYLADLSISGADHFDNDLGLVVSGQVEFVLHKLYL